ncbi:CBS domain-containing protein [Tahibacter amnicola]|uniref:CBS domain-containing protein n=1 Tax=Tahibacter amnicola TaxID=2976241 RepID=A0ABY6BD01_9GAMM|nr:CBS domain-containing protein [Tahibacter amnicola]UXI67614.1 CBS domain-containing protein [Tahibacter amnicola]
MRQVKDLLQGKGREVFSVDPDQPVLAAIQAMADHHVGALLVMQAGELVGIISERDYARKVILLGRSSAETPVWQIMSSPVETVSGQHTVDACMRLCTDRRIRHLPVMDAGKVVGVVSIGDLVKAVIDEQAEELAQLQRYIAG